MENLFSLHFSFRSRRVMAMKNELNWLQCGAVLVLVLLAIIPRGISDSGKTHFFSFIFINVKIHHAGSRNETPTTDINNMECYNWAFHLLFFFVFATKLRKYYVIVYFFYHFLNFHLACLALQGAKTKRMEMKISKPIFGILVALMKKMNLQKYVMSWANDTKKHISGIF